MNSVSRNAQGRAVGPMHRLDARVKVLAVFIALVVCVSTPPDRFGAFAAYFGLVGAAIGMAKIPLTTLFRRFLLILPLLLLSVLFIPFLPEIGGGGYGLGIGPLHVSRSGLLVLWNVLAKSCLGVLGVTLLSETTSFAELLQALERLRFPRFAVMLAGFTHRYAFVLADEAVRMMRARDARGYRGRWLWEAGVIGRMVGALFLRSFERGERVYLAMISRGFDGSMPASVDPLRRSDYLFLTAAAALFIALRVGAA